MSFLSPIWLVLLLPWALLTIYLLTGQRNRVAVPFLPLWDNTLAAPKVKRSFHSPPLAIAMLLLAALLAIIGAAGPSISRFARPSYNAILDRGFMVSAQDRVRSFFTSHIRPHGIMRVPLSTSDRPVAYDTTVALKEALPDRLEWGPVVIFSDRPLEPLGPRVLQIGPEKPVTNVGIISINARSTPHAQVMVRVRNQSALSSATLTVRSGVTVQSQQIQLPPRESEQNYFIDLPSIGDALQVKIDAKDDFAIDNVAWLVRRQAWPRIEPLAPLPTEVQRMVEVYRKNRPSSASSKAVVVTTDIAHLPAGRPGIAIASNSSPPDARGALSIVPHEVTRDIDWSGLASSATSLTVPSGDWTPLVRVGERVILAVREDSRQAAIAIDPRSAALSTQFVSLWGKLFDWAGQGGDVYATDRVHAIDPSWKLLMTDESAKQYDPPLPGVYRRSDGANLAMSAIDVKFASPKPLDQTRFDAFTAGAIATTSLRAVAIGLALLGVLVALWLLKPLKTPVAMQSFPDV